MIFLKKSKNKISEDLQRGGVRENRPGFASLNGPR